MSVYASDRLPLRRLHALMGLVLAMALVGCGRTEAWTESEIATLRSLWLGSLPSLPPDPSNAVADDPRAAALGHKLFFDTRLSRDGTVACATCHQPELGFQDGRPLGRGIGTTTRRTMPIAGVAHSPWFFWDGRKDSLWAQALGPLESPVEHGGDRTFYAHLVARSYREEYEALFGPLPDLSGSPPSAGPLDSPAARSAWEAMAPAERAAVTRVYANVGKSIAAYERRIMPGSSRFDSYVQALLARDRQAMAAALTPDEIAGLKLFIGRANCIQCHSGPLFTNNDFHNTGVPAAFEFPADTGRAAGAQQVLEDEFNCLGPYSDARPEECMALRFLKADGHELVRQFKPPGLRNVAERAPYMHAGQFATLDEVLAHYDEAPAAPGGHSELEPLNLSEEELAQLEAFLRSLSAPLAAPAGLLRPPPDLS